jgi:Flp pilus assembly pilin Flp
MYLAIACRTASKINKPALHLKLRTAFNFYSPQTCKYWANEANVMSRFQQRLLAFATNDEGATAVEYALMGLVVGLSTLGGLTVISGYLSTTFTEIADRFVTILAAN